MKLLIGIIIMIVLGWSNKITNDVVKENIYKLIDFYCDKYSYSGIIIEDKLIKAIIQQESQFKPYCLRFEPRLYKSEYWRRQVPKKYRDNKKAYSSSGLMQVLYTTARQMGYRGSPDELLCEKYSLEYGIKYVRYLIKRYYKIELVIASYNAGSPIYVKDKVKKIRWKIEQAIIEGRNKTTKEKKQIESWYKQLEKYENMPQDMLINQKSYVNPVLKNYRRQKGKINVDALIK